MCILLFVKHLGCSSIPFIYGKLERGYICPKYMCILLYVKFIWCSGILYIYGQLEGGTSAQSICAFCYMLHIFGVVVFYTSMVNWRGYICPKYMCILLYVKLIWGSGIPYISGQLEERGLGICTFCYMWNFCGVAVFHTSMVNWRGTSALSICAFCYMLNLFGVVVFHRSMVNWRRGSLVYVHSAMCETYSV